MADENFEAIVDRPDFWAITEFLEHSGRRVEIDKILSRFSVSRENFDRYISFLERLDYQIEVSSNGKDEFVHAKSPLTGRLGLSLNEWFALQCHYIRGQGEINSPYFQFLDNFIKERWPELEHLLKKSYTKIEKVLSHDPERKKILSAVETAIKEKNLVNLTLKENVETKIFPHRLVFLDETLCLVGEEKSDRCLVFFPLADVKNLSITDLGIYSPNYSMIEVNEFIRSLRLISGNESRLILKIPADLNTPMDPPYQFLANPYVTTNLDGDLIWAASVEKSEELIGWIVSLGSKVQVLDPENIRVEVENLRKKYSQSA